MDLIVVLKDVPTKLSVEEFVKDTGRRRLVAKKDALT